MSTLWEPNGTRKISHSTKSYDANEFAKSEQRKKLYKKKKKVHLCHRRHKGTRTSSRSKRFERMKAHPLRRTNHLKTGMDDQIEFKIKQIYESNFIKKKKSEII